MAVEVETEGTVQVIHFVDRIDSGNAEEAEAAVRAALGAGKDVVLFDMQRLAYISSAGLRVVLIAAKQLRAMNRKMVVCNMAGNIRQVFEISGFLSLLSVYGDRASAIAALEA